jgi:L-threonylcarbamoyladenylate synthase
METRILKIDAEDPEPERLEEAAGVIWRGGIAAVPTDTVYGLAADPANERAVRRIFEVKGRDCRQPLVLLAADMEMVARLDLEMPELAQKAMAHFWPGGLTVIVGKGPKVPEYPLAGSGSVGLRRPAHKAAVGLIEAAGFLLASTSANRSGEPSAISAEMAADIFRGEIEMVIDSGAAPAGRESSVVDFTQSPPRLLREGCISRETLERILGGLG